MNISPNSDPPAQVMDDLWLEESESDPLVDTFGGSKRVKNPVADPFGGGAREDPFVSDPFGDLGSADPFSSPQAPSSSTSDWLEDPRQSELRRRAQADMEKKRKVEARRRAQAEAEARRRAQAEAEAKQRAQAEAEARRRAQAQAEAEARRRAQEAEARRRAQEAEAKQRAQAQAEAEARRRAQEAEAKQRAQVEAKQRAQAEAEARRRAQAKAQAEAETRRRAQEAEARRRAQAQAEAEAEARRHAQARAQAEAEARRRAQEAEARRHAQAQAQAQAQFEAHRQAQEPETRRRDTARQDFEPPPRSSGSDNAWGSDPGWLSDPARAARRSAPPSAAPHHIASRPPPASDLPSQHAHRSRPPSSALSQTSTVNTDQLQRILLPMHQLLRNQAEEIKTLKRELTDQKARAARPKASQPSAELKSMQSELAKLRQQLTEQATVLQQTQAQAMQASALAELSGVARSQTRSSWGVGGLFKSIGSAFNQLKPKRTRSFDELKSLSSGEPPPPPPPVPVYDPFEESTNLEELIQDGSSEVVEDDQERLKWGDDEVNLHRAVVTNAPQAISPEDDDHDPFGGSPEGIDLFADDPEDQAQQPAEDSESSRADDASGSTQLGAAVPVSSIPHNILPPPRPPEFSVGGLTMSRFANTGPDPQLMSIVMQHTQLLKRQEQSFQKAERQSQRQEEVIQNQNEILEQLIKRSQRENEKIQKRVKKLERARDVSQQNASGLKNHHKRISQLEMLIEGFEAKLAAFDEKLSAKDPTKQATDIRVSLDPDEGDFQSIQEAIDAAPVGAYIGVMPGIYQEPIEFVKPVKIIGLGRPQDILIQIKEESALVLNRMGGGYEESMSAQEEREVRKKLQQYTSVKQTSVGSQVVRWLKRQIGQPIAEESVFEAKTGSDEVSLVSVTISSITTEVGGPPSEKPAIVVTSGHLRLEKCEVRCENGHGIVLEGEDARLSMRASRILQVKGSGVVLRTRAQAMLSGSSIVKSKESGVDGQGYTSVRLMDCEVSNNQRIGLQVGFKSQLIAYNTTISGNHFEGVWMNNKSTGTIKGCDMRGNARGPYDISTDCNVEMVGNKP